MTVLTETKTAEQFLAPLIQAGGLRVVSQDNEYIQFKTKMGNPITLENVLYTIDELSGILVHNPHFRKLINRNRDLYPIVQQIFADPAGGKHPNDFEQAKEGQKVKFDDSESVPIEIKLNEHRWQLSKDYSAALFTGMGLVTAYFAIVITAIVAFLIWGIGGYLGWMEEKLKTELQKVDNQKVLELQKENVQQQQEIERIRTQVAIWQLREENQELMKQKGEKPTP